MEQLAGLHVLIVEDEKINSKLLKELLERYGIRVTQAFNGNEALEYMEHEEFDVALIDIHLGDDFMDGVEMLKEYKKMKLPHSTKMVACTAFALNTDKENLLNEGFDSYLSKPFSFPDLLDLLKEFKKELI